MNIQNLNFTVEELKILAENGQKDFIYAVGYYYENGIRTSVNLTEAAVWYEKAAQKGHAEAAMRLALLYAQGKGVEKNEKKAFTYMEQAAKAGGIGVKQDLSKAFDWYKQAAAEGDFRAMCCMGGYFLTGNPVPYEPAKAFQLFEKAANANIPAAQYNLSVLYRYGEGTEKDVEKADFWRMKAAQNGFRMAIDEIEKPAENQ